MRQGGHQRGIRRFWAAVAATTVGLSAAPANALKSDDDTLVEGAKLCTRYLPRHERDYGIPQHLLAAIASTESGRFHKGLGLNLPWPWTINVEGTGYFFDTKQEAINAVRGFQARGIASIDVGCMQVNLHHHPGAFASLEQAFDPAYNVAYAAQFLKQNFQLEGSWRKATADYHSRTPTYGEQYAYLVYSAWSRIINKVADAQAGRPIVTAAVAKPSYVKVVPHAPHYHAVHMHAITVSGDTTREKGVLVIRPQYGSQPAGMQQASLEDNFVTHPRRSAKAASASPEMSAIAPGGIALASTGQEVAHGAQIVKIRADGTVTSNTGQFLPSPRAQHTQNAAPSMFAPDPVVESSARNPFVFNN